MPYVELPIVRVPLDDIRLDLENFRITNGVKDESEALAYLYESEDVLDTAKEILTLGYFDNEVPTAVREPDGSVVVLEGNRRISALKGLGDPSLAPKKYEAALRALIKRYALEVSNLPTEIRVLLAPNREMTQPHIARMHIGLTKKSWSPDQQATFFYAQLSPDVTPEDIKHRHPNENIKKYMKMGSIRRFLKGARFSDSSLHEYVSSNNLKVSVLEYAYRHKSVCDLIGIEFEKNGLLKPEGTDPGTLGSQLPLPKLATLEHLIGKFRAGKLDTRSDALKARSSAHEAFISELQSIYDRTVRETEAPGTTANNAPDDLFATDISGPENHTHHSASFSASQERHDSSKSNATQTSSDSSGASHGEHDRSSQITGSRGPNDPSTKNRLPVHGIDYETNVHINLHDRYQELRRMNYKDFPAATAIMLRSIVETTIKHHFARGQYTVGENLGYGMKCVFEAYNKRKELASTIGYIRNGRSPGSVTWFNMAAHDFNAVVEPAQVYEAWRKVSPLLVFLLRTVPSEGLTMPPQR